MGDHNCSFALHQTVERFKDEFFRGRIESGTGFIEYEDRSIADDGAGNSDALTLSTGESDAAFADDRVVPVRELSNKFIGIGQFGNTQYFRTISAWLAVG